jgi:hypothetical protein
MAVGNAARAGRWGGNLIQCIVARRSLLELQKNEAKL